MPRIGGQFSIPEWELDMNKEFITNRIKDRVEREITHSLANEILKISKGYMIPTIRNDFAEFRLEGYWWSLEEGNSIRNKLAELGAYKQVFGSDNELVKRYQLEQDIKRLSYP